MKETKNPKGMILEWSLSLCFICEGDENFRGDSKTPKKRVENLHALLSCVIICIASNFYISCNETLSPFDSV